MVEASEQPIPQETKPTTSIAPTADNLMKEGDMVIIYLDPTNTSCLKLKKGEKFQNKYGHYRHDDIIGKEYGSKIESKNGFIYALRPTPHLITNSLAHRTQILYHMDISYIIMKLDIKPGDIVVESGTGSGSLSTSLSYAVNPGGHLYTFEFNQERAVKAREQFQEAQLENITVTWRDVCGEGFLPKNEGDYALKEGGADAVFLDLPNPWEAIGHANKILKKGGKICVFSPCIEQIQRAYDELEKNGFVDLRTFECLLRGYEKRQRPLKSLDEKLAGKKRKLNEAFTQNQIKETEDLTQQKPEPEKQVHKEESKVSVEKETKAIPEKESKPKTANGLESGRNLPKHYYTSGMQFAQGHTGYLAFALKYP